MTTTDDLLNLWVRTTAVQQSLCLQDGYTKKEILAIQENLSHSPYQASYV